MTQEVLKLALEALEDACGECCNSEYNPCFQRKAITAIKKALAQPEQEPVAWMFQHEETGRMNYVSNDGIHNPAMFLEMNPRYALVCPLYTTPPQRKPQEFVCSTGLCHYRKPLTNDRAHQILLDMAKHIETFGDENITEQALSAECIRFILERVTAYGIKEEV